MKTVSSLLCGLCAAAIVLFLATSDEMYRTEAEAIARQIMACQVVAGPCAGAMRTLDNSPNRRFSHAVRSMDEISEITSVVS